MSDSKKLHVYAQGYVHESSYIVGTPDALRSLVTAIEGALKNEFHTDIPYTQDGEGYFCTVIALPDEDSRWEQLSLPYTDGERFGLPGGDMFPSELIKHE